MRKIALDAAEEGMVLAKPVTRDNGMVLVAAGTAVTAALLDRLRRMGIDRIVVEGDEPGAASVDAASRLARLDHLFRGFGDNAFMMKIKAMIARRITSKAQAAAAQGGEDAGNGSAHGV
ncbi:hypothetical protein TDMWS_17910 [Thermodesulfomicrobium sp. WS]|uniref:hypothetical protein n=1 Tax=Thermodesulfomicrobium sp. WS TaxID=3004129 RepID=UPI00249302C2|nr:hypothetical protein [Thermodesulfomicrobium sp. WS]BDV01706.1 hypothetical protein TDMWS_17910 [Thermodesulfomicrobium sp. WS]